MATQVKGTLDRINSIMRKTKFGDKPAYSVQVDGDWYGHGFQRPSAREGSVVQFTANQNSRGYWDIEGEIEVLKAEQPAAPGGGGNTSGGTAALSNRDKSITLQTAYKVAPMIVDTMIKAEVLSFPKTKKEASQDAIMEVTQRIAYELQAQFLEPDKFNPLPDGVEDEQQYGEFEDE